MLSCQPYFEFKFDFSLYHEDINGYVWFLKRVITVIMHLVVVKIEPQLRVVRGPFAGQ